SMEKKCLPCHGDPQKAPPRLLETYGKDNGFHWPLGEVVSATIIQVPVDNEINAQKFRYFVLAGGGILLLFLLIGLHHRLFEKIFARRLTEFAAIMNAMGDNLSSSHRLPEETDDEFGALARAFKRMSSTMLESYQELERKIQQRSIALRDKTEEHADTAAAMKVMEQYHHQVLQSLGEGIFGIDIDTKTTFINPAGASMLGWSMDELVGKPIHERIHHTLSDGSPATECPILATLTDGQSRRLDRDVFWHRDGSSFPVEYTATPILRGTIIQGAVVYFRDISQRVAAEQKKEQWLHIQQSINTIYPLFFAGGDLHEKLHKGLREILSIPWLRNQSRGAIFLKDETSGDFILKAYQGFDSETIRLFTRLSHDQSFSDEKIPCLDAFHKVTLPGMKDHEHHWVPFITQTGCIGTLTLVLPQGHTCKSHEAEALTAIGHCLTQMIEHQRSEESLRSYNLALEERVQERTREFEEHFSSMKTYQDQMIRSERMAALGEMVAGISHEINTPMGISFTSANFLADKTAALETLRQTHALDATQIESYCSSAREATEIIQSNLKRAWELIKNFKMAAVDQTKQERRKINLKDYLEGVLLNLRPVLKKTKHTVRIDCLPNFSLTTCPGAIAQILTNLVMNSLIHGFKDKEIGHISIEVSIDREEWVLVYQDNGRGMDREAVKRVFEPFFTTRSGEEGSGLGMYVAYNQVTQTLRGTVTCQSSLGEGVTFVIRIPIDTAEQNQMDTASIS
ncbi:MAG TPA: PAS domain S-box protein, partial [Magnetococcales bacterium]|nr:PAS domain S-box protein [Magnetococcales bacterium]